MNNFYFRVLLQYKDNNIILIPQTFAMFLTFFVFFNYK